MRFLFWCRLLFSALCLGILIGCEQSVITEHSNELFGIQGTVMVDNAPVDSALITFIPKQPGGTTAQAAISQGKFSLAKSDGLAAGPYEVRIQNPTVEFEQIRTLDDLPGASESAAQQVQRVPHRFSQPDTLQCLIQSVDNQQLNFLLSSQ